MASKIFKDRPQTPLEEAIYWTEYVIRYNGAPQLRTKGSQLPWYQYYLIDVAIVLLSISVAIITIIYVVLSYIFNTFNANSKLKIN